ADAAAAGWEVLNFDIAFLEERFANAPQVAATSARSEQMAADDAATALMRTPLWPEGMPDEMRDNWTELRNYLTARAGENWQVWTDWYQDTLKGDPGIEALEIEKALIPDADWEHKDGPAHENALIADMIEGHAPKPSDTSGPEETPPLPEQNTHGARWTITGDNIAIAPGLPDIGEHAEALQPLAVDALEELLEALGQSNQFKRLSDKASKALDIARSPLPEANKLAAALWTCSVWMGDFAERDDAVRANPRAFADALEEDQRLALSAAVRQTAGFARQFRTALEMDAEDAAFRRTEFRIEPHRRLITVAHEAELIDDDSHETVGTMLEAAEGDAIQGGKAKSTLSVTVRNLLIASTLAIVAQGGVALNEAAKIAGKDAGTGFSEGLKLHERARRLG
ncbi:MAG: hypothetical protein AB8B85_02790, partial [Paracoccaceae bacterium]